MALQVCAPEWRPCVSTFMIDGLVQPDMSSGDGVSDWVTRLLGVPRLIYWGTVRSLGERPQAGNDTRCS